MTDVNAALAERDLPPLEMTVAVNSGEVVVGTIGSETRAKYGVVGSPVNLTARVQTLAAPGEVLITDMTYRDAGGEGGPVRLRETRHVSLKGFSEPIAVHTVASVEGGGAVPEDEDDLRVLEEPLPFGMAVLDGKEVSNDDHAGRIVALSKTGARARVEAEVEPRSDVCLSLDLPSGRSSVYAKVLDVGDEGGDGRELRLRFSSVPPEAAEAFGQLA